MNIKRGVIVCIILILIVIVLCSIVYAGRTREKPKGEGEPSEPPKPDDSRAEAPGIKPSDKAASTASTNQGNNPNIIIRKDLSFAPAAGVPVWGGNLTNPPDGTWFDPDTFINATFTNDLYNIINCTLEWNRTTAPLSFSIYNMSINATGQSVRCWINQSDIDGNYTYRVCANDTAGYSNCTGYQWLIFDGTRSNATPLSPANNTITRNQTANITVNVTDNFRTANVTLILKNSTGNVYHNETKNVSAVTPFNVTLQPGRSTGYFIAYDYAGNCENKPQTGTCTQQSDFAITYDPYNPIYGTPLAIGVLDPSFFMNVTFSDAITNISACWLEWSNTSNSYNITMNWNGTGQSAACWFNVTNSTPPGFADGNYTYRACANDTVNNINCTGYNWTLFDTTAPNITILSPANISTVPTGLINLSYNITDNYPTTHNVSINITNSTGSLVYHNSTLCTGVSCTPVLWTVNISYVDTFNVTITARSLQQTLTYQFTTWEDTDYPTSAITDAASQTDPWMFINVTFSDTATNISACRLEWSKTGINDNLTMSWNGTGKSAACWINVTNNTGPYPDGNYTYRACANDSVNHVNCTDYNWTIFDNTPPNATILSPANSSIVVAGEINFSVNVTDNLQTSHNCTLNITNSTGDVVYNNTKECSGSNCTPISWLVNITYADSFNVTAIARSQPTTVIWDFSTKLCGNGAVNAPEECDGASDTACPDRCQADCTCGAAQTTPSSSTGGGTYPFGCCKCTSKSGEYGYFDNKARNKANCENFCKESGYNVGEFIGGECPQAPVQRMPAGCSITDTFGDVTSTVFTPDCGKTNIDNTGTCNLGDTALTFSIVSAVPADFANLHHYPAVFAGWGSKDSYGLAINTKPNASAVFMGAAGETAKPQTHLTQIANLPAGVNVHKGWHLNILVPGTYKIKYGIEGQKAKEATLTVLPKNEFEVYADVQPSGNDSIVNIYYNIPKGKAWIETSLSEPLSVNGNSFNGNKFPKTGGLTGFFTSIFNGAKSGFADYIEVNPNATMVAFASYRVTNKFLQKHPLLNIKYSASPVQERNLMFSAEYKSFILAAVDSFGSSIYGPPINPCSKPE